MEVEVYMGERRRKFGNQRTEWSQESKLIQVPTSEDVKETPRPKFK